MKKTLMFAAVGLSIIGMAWSALAADVTGDVEATGNVQGKCKAITLGSLSFAIDPETTSAVTGSLYAIQDAEKVPLEFVNVTLQVGSREIPFPTGKGGEFYIENSFPEDPQDEAADPQSCKAIAARRKSGGNYIPPGTHRAFAEFSGRKCEFTLTFSETEDVITDLGEIQCVIH